MDLPPPGPSPALTPIARTSHFHRRQSSGDLQGAEGEQAAAALYQVLLDTGAILKDEPLRRISGAARDAAAAAAAAATTAACRRSHRRRPPSPPSLRPAVSYSSHQYIISLSGGAVYIVKSKAAS